MADTNWGENLGSQLMAGFVQGRRMSLEKKRLSLAEKEQQALTDYRLQQLSLQQQQMQQQQGQFAESMAFGREKMGVEKELRERDIEATLELKKSYNEILDYYNRGRIAQDQSEQISGVLSDATNQIGKIVMDEFMDEDSRSNAVWSVLQTVETQIAALPVSEVEKEGIRKMIGDKVTEIIMTQEGQSQRPTAKPTTPENQGGAIERLGKSVWGWFSNTGER